VEKPIGRSRSRWECSIKRGLQEMVGGMEWIDLAQDRDRWRALVDAIMNLRFFFKKDSAPRIK
jgi:hypothetical protein